MKQRIYMRVAKHPNGKAKVVAGVRPSNEPLSITAGHLPTVAFAINVEIPDEAFRQAERVIAELTISEEAIDIASGTTLEVVE